MYLHLKVTPQAKEEKVTKLSDDHFEISVREPAERNMANKRILEIICTMFPGKFVRIINGHHSPSKLLSIESKEDD